jgi:hypothetical protein
MHFSSSCTFHPLFFIIPLLLPEGIASHINKNDHIGDTYGSDNVRIPMSSDGDPSTGELMLSCGEGHTGPLT